LDDGSNRDNGRPQNNLSRPAEDIARPDGTHSAKEAANIVEGRHGALHVRGRVSESLQEVFVDNDIAKDALVVAVEDQDSGGSAGDDNQ
jgi:hypothetical protein